VKRNRVLAIVGAAVLTMGVVGVALAEELLDGQVGQALSTFNQENCDQFPLEIGAGEIGVHFVLSNPDADSGTLDATFSTDSFAGLASADTNSNALMWYAVITGDLDTTILSAHTDVNGKSLVISHVCPGEETSSSSTTSFESSEESSTTSESSSESTTSFESSEESTTTTQPPTDTIGNSGNGQQSGGMWLLLAALGVLAGSVIVLAPSKAKSRD
jgi:hypothetical protein